MKIKKYSIEKIPPHKSHAIWAWSAERNGIYPICFLTKPKHLTDDQFDKVLKAINLEAATDFLCGLDE